VLGLAVGARYLNARVWRLPTAIGLMATALVGSLVLVTVKFTGVVDGEVVLAFVGRIDFANVPMHDLLGLLLFAGALHVDYATSPRIAPPSGRSHSAARY
jgi:monovalent cation:H+ antiporter, CPA1 family